MTEINTAPAPSSPPPSEVNPLAEARRYSPVVVAWHDRAGDLTEQYRALRTSLLAQYASDRFSLLVTSAEQGEGKTVTCVNMGFVMAERYERSTIIVDGDLRRGGVASMLGLKSAPGLAEVLRKTSTLDAVIQPTVCANLSVITAGDAATEDVANLLSSGQMTATLQELQRRYDYVLLDCPAVSMLADVGMLGRMGCEALLVVRMNRTRRETVNRAIRMLQVVNVRMAGMVLTHQKFYIPGFLYKRL